MPSTKLASGNCEIATHAELKAALAQRAAPEANHNLTPDRRTALTVNSEVATEREKRIAFLRERLDQAGQQVQTDHSFARLKGHARADFDRER